MKRTIGAAGAHGSSFSRVSFLRTLAAATGLALAAGGAALAQQPERIMYAQGRVLVQPRAGLPLAELDKVVKEHGGRRGHALRPINVHVIELPAQANLRAVVEALRRNPKLKFAEMDIGWAPALVPNDPQYAAAWHLPKIGAPTAWDAAQGTGVTIAILDSGVDTTHPDLKPQLVAGWNFFDNNDNVSDVFGHGTSVAGVAAAAGNNGLGVAAVSFRSKIMPMRVTDTSGYGYSSLMASALTAAADNGARVANISFLGVSGSATIQSAAQYMRNKGGVVVIAGGNTGALRTDPVTSVFTAVSATDGSDARASFSSWGNYIDVAAPGVSIPTTTRGGGYGGFSGTSASSPVVAGVYGLMMSANPALQPASLDNILFTTAADLGAAGFDQQFGNGRVNAAAAVAKAQQSSTGDTQPPGATITTPTGGAKVSGFVPVNVTATDNVGVARVDLLVNGTVVASDATAPYALTFDSAAYEDGKQLSLQARAVDAAGNAGSSSTVAVTVANDVTPPVVTINNPKAGSTVTGTVSVSVTATDDKKVAKISLTIDGREVAVAYGGSLNYSWNTGGKGKGGKGGKNAGTSGSTSSSLSARAEDAAGNPATSSITVTKQ
jgi:subtilisin family serine protease